MIQSNHSHSGPDALGVWGGVPDEYLRYVADQTVEAIVEAYATMEPAKLYYGTAPGRDLLSNQFDYDEANEAVDSDVRVLQARDGDRAVRDAAELLRAHDRARLGGNTKASGDWVQAANPLLEERFGGKAVTVVATLGRTQPADRGCSDPGANTEDKQNLCKIETTRRAWWTVRRMRWRTRSRWAATRSCPPGRTWCRTRRRTRRSSGSSTWAAPSARR